jgi:uncharacterized protein YfkK (UPF0435 family)
MNSNIVKELSSVLVKNIDESNIKEKDINLITSGGAFNASYLVGCLYVIREMREKGLIRINKISTCSGSAILGLLFLVDKLDMFVDKLYDILVASFKKNKIVIFDDESLLNIMKIIEDELPEDVISIINNKLYITYYDVLECKQIVKSKYKDVNDIFNTIRRSCFIPYLTMNKFLEDNRYVDGGTPYIFDKEVGVKRLYINLCGMDKIIDAIVIKKDKIVMHRILGGVIDIHNFFFRCKKTSMCNYVEDWDIIRLIEFKMLEIRIFSICIIIYMIIKVKSSIVDKYYKDNKLINDVCKKCRISLSKIIEMYCV